MTSCPHKTCLCFLYRPHFTYFTNFPEASCHELGLRPRKKFFFQSQIHSLHEYIQFIMNGITLWWLTLQRRFEGSLPFLHTCILWHEFCRMNPTQCPTSTSSNIVVDTWHYADENSFLVTDWLPQCKWVWPVIVDTYISCWGRPVHVRWHTGIYIYMFIYTYIYICTN